MFVTVLKGKESEKLHNWEIDGVVCDFSRYTLVW